MIINKFIFFKRRETSNKKQQERNNIVEESHRIFGVFLAKRVSSKLEEGDFTGAVKMASSDDKFTPLNDTTLSALQSRHPPAPADSAILSVDTSSCPSLEVLEFDVLNALSSFPYDSAAGPDCL